MQDQQIESLFKALKHITIRMLSLSIFMCVIVFVACAKELTLAADLVGLCAIAACFIYAEILDKQYQGTKQKLDELLND